MTTTELSQEEKARQLRWAHQEVGVAIKKVAHRFQHIDGVSWVPRSPEDLTFDDVQDALHALACATKRMANVEGVEPCCVLKPRGACSC